MKNPKVYRLPKGRVRKIVELLEEQYPDAKVALNYTNPLEILIATMLSAQTTDERVNIVTKSLFKKYKTPQDYVNINIKELEDDIHSTGFYHNKARNLQNCCKMLIEKFNGQVPKTMPELLELPGVARKTANIVMYNAYGIVEGIAVDTHVRRLSQRLGLADTDNTDKIEKELMQITPREDWMKLTDLLILHGRKICDAKKTSMQYLCTQQHLPQCLYLQVAS